MSENARPRGLTETAVLMAITNAMGWGIIDWSRPHAHTTFVVITMIIVIGYVVLWFYWKGRNWARVFVLLNSFICFYNLRYWNRHGIFERTMLGMEALLAVFLLCWLNTRAVRAFFQRQRTE